MDPKGKIVVVTGATSGLGQAFAVEIARQGARVILVGRDAARANETLQQIAQAGGQAEVVLGDVSTVAGAKQVPSGAYPVKGKPAALPKQVNDAAVRAKVYGLLEKLATA